MSWGSPEFPLSAPGVCNPFLLLCNFLSYSAFVWKMHMFVYIVSIVIGGFGDHQADDGNRGVGAACGGES